MGQGVLDTLGFIIDPITFTRIARVQSAWQKIQFTTSASSISISSITGLERKMGGYPIVRLKHIGTKHMDINIFRNALKYILFIKHAASVVGLKKSEEDKV